MALFHSYWHPHIMVSYVYAPADRAARLPGGDKLGYDPSFRIRIQGAVSQVMELAVGQLKVGLPDPAPFVSAEVDRKAVCERHSQAYVMSAGCPYCE